MHALIASRANDTLAQTLLECWHEDALKISDYNWVTDLIDSAKRVFTIYTTEAIAVMRDSRLTSDMQFLAVTRLMSDPNSDIDRLFNAQVLIVGWIVQRNTFWSYELGSHISSTISRVWKERCEFRADLRNSRLTVPEIQRECDSMPEGLAKAARILMAAANAVTIQMSDELRRDIQAAASAGLVNPYRFATR